MEIQKDHIHKQHNKNALLYHLVCPVRYRRKAVTNSVEKTIISTCQSIGERYEMHFVEIGVDNDHVHFLIQSVPTYSPKSIVQTVKSILSREIFQQNPEVKKMLWGGKFWTSGYYINTVGIHGSKESIQQYVKQQGNNYSSIYNNIIQLSLFN